MNTCFENFKDNKCLVSAVGCSLVFLLIVLGISIIINFGESDSQVDQSRVITFTDSSEKFVKPDLAIVSFSVVTTKKTVALAMEENTKNINQVVSKIKELGVDEKDIKTTSFSIYPKYEWQKDISELYPNGRSVLIGYEVRQSVQTKIRDMEKIGEIIQGATNAGANEVGNLSFSIDNDEAIKAEVRKEAIDKVKNKAKELAHQLGVRLKKVVSFSESGNVPMSYDYASSYKSEVMGMGGGAAPEIQTGENSIKVTVSITYQIQ